MTSVESGCVGTSWELVHATENKLGRADVASHTRHPYNSILLSGSMILRLNCETFEDGAYVKLEALLAWFSALCMF